MACMGLRVGESTLLIHLLKVNGCTWLIRFISTLRGAVKAKKNLSDSNSRPLWTRLLSHNLWQGHSNWKSTNYRFPCRNFQHRPLIKFVLKVQLLLKGRSYSDATSFAASLDNAMTASCTKFKGVILKLHTWVFQGFFQKNKYNFKYKNKYK